MPRRTPKFNDASIYVIRVLYIPDIEGEQKVIAVFFFLLEAYPQTTACDRRERQLRSAAVQPSFSAPNGRNGPLSSKHGGLGNLMLRCR